MACRDGALRGGFPGRTGIRGGAELELDAQPEAVPLNTPQMGLLGPIRVPLLCHLDYFENKHDLSALFPAKFAGL